jgi:uncharacterized membrane protein
MRDWKDALSLFVLVVGAALVLMAYPTLPAQVPVHFGLRGTANGWMPREMFVWLMPSFAALISLVVRFAWIFVPKGPKRDAARRTPGSTMGLILAAFITGVNMCILHVAREPNANVLGMLLVLLGLLWLALGGVMTKLSPNPINGIRTKWTLASEENWNRTHKIASVTFAVAGFGVLLCALLPSPVSFALALAAMLGSTLGPVVYSYALSRRGV